MCSARNRGAIRIKTVIRLVLARPDARHDEGLRARVTELIIATCWQHDRRVLARSDNRLAIAARIELRRALQNQKNVIFFRVRVKSIFANARGIAMNSQSHQIGLCHWVRSCTTFACFSINPPAVEI